MMKRKVLSIEIWNKIKVEANYKDSCGGRQKEEGGETKT